MLILFCACVAVIAYVYFGYPLLLWLGAIGRRELVRREFAAYPLISIIVAAHNEESCIEEKLLNLLALDYPRDRVEILIGSDGSSDRTEAIVRRFAREGVGLVSFPQQHGKSAMQNSLVAAACGEILVFTDSDCLLPRAAVSRLLENFADPRVGLVSACPRFRNASETAVTGNESLYLRYETWLRQRESELGVLAMASGSLFAVRRSLWQPLAPHFGDDFVLPLRVIRAGTINRIDSRVVAFTSLSQTRAAGMLRMKSRIVSKDFSALLAHRDLLNPLRYGSASTALWSHKLLRWLVPYFLLGLLTSNALLLARPCMSAFLYLQIVFYAAALIGFASRNRRTRLPWQVPMSFCLVNFAALVGTAKALAGRSSGVWKPERRPTAAAATHFRATATPRVIK
jgi:cellulose synthase/poly-beta-1,6-N-acetylglucosamine synthase-like glycosyltransferase